MTNPFATWTLEDLAEDAARPGMYVLKATTAARIREPVKDAQCTGSEAETLPIETTEEEFLGAIRKLAKDYGWEIYHTYNSQRSEPGWPDTVITDGTSLLIYELKNNTRKPTHEQEVWLSLLAHTRLVECGIWRPKDWPQIHARLTRKEHPMTPHPYRVVCQTRTATTLSYLSEWFPTPDAAQQAQAQHEQEGWQQVDLVAPGQVPAASITGKQVLARGGFNVPRRKGA